jgi:hypothetical protein
MEIVNKQALDKVVQEIKAGEQKEYKFLGHYRRTIKGGRLFAYDIETGVMAEVEVKKSDVVAANGVPGRDAVYVEKGKIYVEALNLKNAIRRLLNKKIIVVT